jgi:1-acyl-sn-glycerol-3-phosphate acyltransferase
MSHLWVRMTRGMRWRRIQKKVKYARIKVSGGEIVRDLLASNHGVMLASNHSAHYDSEAVYCALDKYDIPTFIMTSWQVFANIEFWQIPLIQGIGCFSINREGSDRNAFKESVRILRKEPYPLLIFPEGDIYHQNDHVTQFREGIGAIAMTAARHEERKIVIVPVGVKFHFIDDPRPSLRKVLGNLEQRLLLRVKPKHSLLARIDRICNAAIGLKEIEMLGASRSGDLFDRAEYLMQHILARLELRHGDRRSAEDIPDRVKSMRQIVIEKINDELNRTQDVKQPLVRQLQLEMEDLFTVMQLYSYPRNYLSPGCSIERIAETIDKLEEDISFAKLPTVHGRKLVEVRFGEPIDVPVARSRELMTEISTSAQQRVQQLINEMNGEHVDDSESVTDPAGELQPLMST